MTIVSSMALPPKVEQGVRYPAPYLGQVAYNARQHEIHLQYLPCDGQPSCLYISRTTRNEIASSRYTFQ